MPMESRSQIDANLNETNRVSLESAEAPSAKRRREGQSAGFSVEGPFDQLLDDLTEEFLCRLPLRSILRFRCVCKGWRSLITSPPFLQLLERRHNLLEKDHPVGLLLQGIRGDSHKWFVDCSGVPKSKCFGYSLEFLPVLRQPNYSFVVRGSCDDLLLCSYEEWVRMDLSLFYYEEWVQKDFFIMNFVTREWKALPPIPRVRCNSVFTGLVGDPTSIPEAKKGANLRYRVVRIPIPLRSENGLNVEIFSSEDGQWNKYVMRCDSVRKMSFCCQTAVACNGSLYWKYVTGEIMALDAFNPMKKGVVVIECPPDSLGVYFRAEHIGIHRGKLRMCQTRRAFDGVYERSVLHIWELEEGEGGAKWRSVKVASLEPILAANPSYIIPSSDGSTWPMWITLALHPIDEDIIYFGCTKRKVIISCNLKTSSLEIVCNYNFNKWNSNVGVVFPIVMPWCPTPVPALPNL